MKLRPYPEYKDSGIEWIGEIPEDWHIQKMKKLSFFQEGPGLRNWQFTSKGIRVICVTNITGRGIDFTNYEKFISEEEYKQSYKHFTVEKGDLLLSSSGNSWGKVAEYESDETVILNTSTIRINESQGTKKVERMFLKWALQSESVREQLGLMMTGSCQPNFGPSHLSEAIMCFPNSIREQKTITSFLDKKTSEIDETIQKDTQLIELLQEKRIALTNHVVTKGLDPDTKMKDSGVEWIGEIPEKWEIDKIKNRVAVRISNVDKKTKQNEPDVLLCNYTDVYNNEFITAKLNFMKATASIEQIKKLSLEKSDVIITKDSETAEDIAVPALVNEELNNVICGYHLALLRPNQEEITGNFLFRLLQSKKINDQFVNAANGVTRFGISTYPIKNAYILLPPLDEQKNITKHLDKETAKIDETINKIESKIKLMGEYRKSLIHHVVTGKVDVRGEESLKQIHQKKDSKQTLLTI